MMEEREFPWPKMKPTKVMYARMLDIVFLSGIEDANGILFIHFPADEWKAGKTQSGDRDNGKEAAEGAVRLQPAVA